MADRVLEICCDSVESGLAAAEGGADRVELCVDLCVGGLTPPVELLRELKGEIVIPVFVLVRCRDGGFVFSEAEVARMVFEIEALCDAGADGVVCGALTAAGEIDLVATRRFMDAGGGLPFTFHKGFDSCTDLEIGMRELVEAGVDRVLTSGGARIATDGSDTLARLAKIGGAETQVLCGGGVRAGNLPALAAIPGVWEFHSAARVSVARPVDVGEVRAMATLLE